MLIDAHVHCSGGERSADVLRSLDDAKVDVAVLLAPFLSEGYSLDDAASLQRANAHLGDLVRGHADRLIGFAVVDPRDPQASRHLRRAVETHGLRGVKMVPTGWYPYDRDVQPVFAEARELGIPILFHSGIFIDGRSGRFCRPAFFEVLRDHPGLRVTLAHLGWPWVDEAIAVGLIDRIHGVPPDDGTFRFDISFGPPPPYRREALGRALEVLGPELLQFGSDCFLPCPGSHIAERIGWVETLLDELGVAPAARERIWSGTAAAWLGLRTPDRPGDALTGARPGHGDAAAGSAAPDQDSAAPASIEPAAPRKPALLAGPADADADFRADADDPMTAGGAPFRPRWVCC